MFKLLLLLVLSGGGKSDVVCGGVGGTEHAAPKDDEDGEARELGEQELQAHETDLDVNCLR